MAEHPYERIAEHYRKKIRDRELAEGERLPTVAALAREWGMATGTIRHAMSWLQVEGYIRTSPRGTFVANEPPTGSTPHDRLNRMRRTGSTLATGETKLVTAAALVVPPLYVAEIFDLDPGDQVVRREFTTGIGRRRVMFAVNWYLAQMAAVVPDLLSTAPRKCDDAVKLIEGATGRRVKYERDAMHAREASEREANYLGVPIGDSILAGAHEWSDDEGLIEYGEWCLPKRLTIGYENLTSASRG
jgi:GntR family transcriptional regulator